MGLIASGGVTSGMLGNVCVFSGQIGSGQVGAFAIVSGLTVTPFGVASGYLASGAVTTNTMASGHITPATLAVQPYFSGFTGPITLERISGVRAVQITASGIRIAMASVSGRMPAHAIAVNNVESGFPVNLVVRGHLQVATDLANYSGYTGGLAFVGRSGQVVSVSGSFASGGTLSGDFGQTVGVLVNSGGLLVNMGWCVAYSGGTFALASAGVGPMGLY